MLGGVLVACMAAILAMHWFGIAAGVVAGLAAGLYPRLVYYETQLLMQARAKDSQQPAAADGAAASPARPPISAEQIKILMDRIRSTREGAFAPIAQQPALQALLLPFGSYGGVQLIEYLFKL